MPPAKCDVLIVGGGIVGLATAWSLVSRFQVAPVVLEAEERLASHQTGNNSGVIHSGLYYKPGSLKAQNCKSGREALYRFCQQYEIRHERCGKVVVATEPDELPALDEIERRGLANGLTSLRRLNAAGIREIEPHCGGIAGLWVGETGIVDYVQVAHTYARLAQEWGATIHARLAFRRLVRRGAALIVETSGEPLEATSLINCGGLQADRVARACGVDPGIRIVPFRGEYYELVPKRQFLVKNLIYPVPDPRFPFLGVHFTRMAKGGIECGPNAVLAFKRHGYHRASFSPRDVLDMAGYGGFWRMAARYWKTGLGELRRSWSKAAFVAALARLLPELRAEDITPAGAGVRAQALGSDGRLIDDFQIVSAERMIHVLNAPSPAATASLSIGATIADQAAQAFGLRPRIVQPA